MQESKHFLPSRLSPSLIGDCNLSFLRSAPFLLTLWSRLTAT
jgi:hypothetical protein